VCLTQPNLAAGELSLVLDGDGDLSGGSIRSGSLYAQHAKGGISPIPCVHPSTPSPTNPHSRFCALPHLSPCSYCICCFLHP
jgi:hypothetical protein